LGGYDYAQPGAYFVTICTRDRQCLFGHVVNGDMRLNDAGEVARCCWEEIPVHFPFVELDTFMIMPNHVHGVIVVPGRGDRPRLSQNLMWLVR
jgi:putative transposase